jgi:hypothetical protein
VDFGLDCEVEYGFGSSKLGVCCPVVFSNLNQEFFLLIAQKFIDEENCIRRTMSVPVLYFHNGLV